MSSTWDHDVAGPYATRLMAAQGAEVIKVERIDGGDPARRQGPFHSGAPHLEKSALFLYLNTARKGITLNLKTSAGREIPGNLVERSKTVRPNTTAAL